MIATVGIYILYCHNILECLPCTVCCQFVVSLAWIINIIDRLSLGTNHTKSYLIINAVFSHILLLSIVSVRTMSIRALSTISLYNTILLPFIHLRLICVFMCYEIQLVSSFLTCFDTVNSHKRVSSLSTPINILWL